MGNTILKEFETYLFEDGKSVKTIESYVGDIKGLLEYLLILTIVGFTLSVIKII